MSNNKMKRPFQLYLIAIWLFIVVPGFLGSWALKVLDAIGFGIPYPQSLSFKGAITVLIIVVSFKTVKMKRWAHIFSVITLNMVSISWIFVIFVGLLNGRLLPMPSSISVPILILLNGLITWYLMRNSMRETVKSYSEYNKKNDFTKNLL